MQLDVIAELSAALGPGELKLPPDDAAPREGSLSMAVELVDAADIAFRVAQAHGLIC